VNETEPPDSPGKCCGTLFYAHLVHGRDPLVVLECCVCGRLWHRRMDGILVAYDQELLAPLGERRDIP